MFYLVKNPPANAGDADSIPGSGRSPGEANGNSLQNSGLENPMDRGAWQAIVHGVTRVRHDLVTKQPPDIYIHMYITYTYVSTYITCICYILSLGIYSLIEHLAEVKSGGGNNLVLGFCFWGNF